MAVLGWLLPLWALTALALSAGAGGAGGERHAGRAVGGVPVTRWVSKAAWARAKGSVSKQLKEKAGPKVRLGGQVVKRGTRLGIAGAAGKRWKAGSRRAK
jgi:hypothetical protein